MLCKLAVAPLNHDIIFDTIPLLKLGISEAYATSQSFLSAGILLREDHFGQLTGIALCYSVLRSPTIGLSLRCLAGGRLQGLRLGRIRCSQYESFPAHHVLFGAVERMRGIYGRVADVGGIELTEEPVRLFVFAPEEDGGLRRLAYIHSLVLNLGHSLCLSHFGSLLSRILHFVDVQVLSGEVLGQNFIRIHA